jgi:hypothetical protein
MALTETTVEDKIEVVGDFKHVQIRTATIIARDGVEISRSFHRHILACSNKSGEVKDEGGNITTEGTWSNTDISGESAEVQAICNAIWTTAVKTAYQTARDAQDALGA